MLKKKNAKKIMKNYEEKAILIECKKCLNNEGCKTRANKEKSEQLGIYTYCTMAKRKNTKNTKKNKYNKYKKQGQ